MERTFSATNLLNLRRLPAENAGFVASTLRAHLATLPASPALALVSDAFGTFEHEVEGLVQVEKEWARWGPGPNRTMEAVNLRASASAQLSQTDATADGLVGLTVERLEMESRLQLPGRPEALAADHLLTALFSFGVKELTQKAYTAQLFTYEELEKNLHLPSIVAAFGLLHLESLRLRLAASLSAFATVAREANLHLEEAPVTFADLSSAREATHAAYCELCAAILGSTRSDPDLRAALLAPILHEDAAARRNRRGKSPSESEDPLTTTGTEDSPAEG